MEKIYISDWFKAPTKKQTNRIYTIKEQKNGAGRKYAKSRKKTKKQTSKKSG